MPQSSLPSLIQQSQKRNGKALKHCDFHCQTTPVSMPLVQLFVYSQYQYAICKIFQMFSFSEMKVCVISELNTFLWYISVN